MSSTSRWSGAERARSVLALGATVTVLLVGGCGVGPQDAPDLVAAPPSAGPGEGTATPGVPMTVQVYLLRGDHVVRVSRAVPDGTGVAPSLAGLTLDLTPTEVSDGLRTAVPHGAGLHGRIEGPVAVISMPAGFDGMSVHDQVAAMSQLVFTITANTVATEVRMTRGSRAIPVPDGAGRLLTRPVNTADYATWAPMDAQ